MTLTEQIAAVLAEHYYIRSRWVTAQVIEFTCKCGETYQHTFRGTRDGHRAHQAAHIAPLVRQAQAEAWDAHTEWGVRAFWDDGMETFEGFGGEEHAARTLVDHPMPGSRRVLMRREVTGWIEAETDGGL